MTPITVMMMKVASILHLISEPNCDSPYSSISLNLMKRHRLLILRRKIVALNFMQNIFNLVIVFIGLFFLVLRPAWCHRIVTQSVVPLTNMFDDFPPFLIYKKVHTVIVWTFFYIRYLRQQAFTAITVYGRCGNPVYFNCASVAFPVARILTVNMPPCLWCLNYVSFDPCLCLLDFRTYVCTCCPVSHRIWINDLRCRVSINSRTIYFQAIVFTINPPVNRHSAQRFYNIFCHLSHFFAELILRGRILMPPVW